MVTTMFLWGVSFVASKIVIDAIGPVPYMGIRFLLAGAVLAAVVAVIGRPRFALSTHALIAATALAEPIAYFLFESYGLAIIGATTTSLIIALIPLAVMLLAAAFLGESLHLRGVVAVFISIAGVALLVYGGDIVRANASVGNAAVATLDPAVRTRGVLLVLGAVFAAAGYITMARSLTQKHDPVRLTVVQTWWGAAFFVSLWQIRTPGLETVSAMSPLVWGALAFLVLGATVAAFLLYNWALRYETAGTASLYINAIPVITAVTAWAVLGERLVSLQWAGAALVLAAVRLSSRRSRRATAKTITTEA